MVYLYGRSYVNHRILTGNIFYSAYPLELGCFADVKILNTDDYDLIGVVA